MLAREWSRQDQHDQRPGLPLGGKTPTVVPRLSLRLSASLCGTGSHPAMETLPPLISQAGPQIWVSLPEGIIGIAQGSQVRHADAGNSGDASRPRGILRDLRDMWIPRGSVST